jgi:membrane protease YdiL (CAAX protease family)
VRRGPRWLAGGGVGAIALFLAVAFAVSWSVWAAPARAALAGAAVPPSLHYHHLLGALGPALAALLVAACEGRPSLASLLARLDPRRGKARWLALGLLGPLLLYALAAVVLRLAGAGWPRLADFGASREYAELGRGGYWLANVFFYGYGEELGWRGFLLPRLQQRAGALTSALLVSAVWALWHLPLFWFSPGMSSMGAAAVAGWLFSLVTGSILMTWLFNVSEGNVTAVALFHGVLDIVMGSPGPAAASSIMGAALTIWGLVVAFLGRKVTAVSETTTA